MEVTRTFYPVNDLPRGPDRALVALSGNRPQRAGSEGPGYMLYISDAPSESINLNEEKMAGFGSVR